MFQGSSGVPVSEPTAGAVEASGKDNPRARYNICQECLKVWRETLVRVAVVDAQEWSTKTSDCSYCPPIGALCRRLTAIVVVLSLIQKVHRLTDIS